MPGRVLIVDDDQSLCATLQVALRQRGFETSWRTAASEALAALDELPCEVVLSDLKMPGMDGIDLCTQIGVHRPDLPVVVMTAFGSLDAAVAAIRAGAYDFVTKPVTIEVLAVVLQRAVRHYELQEKVRVLSEAVDHGRRFATLLGESPVMQALFAQLQPAASCDAIVLITGESGTGKEVVARVLHGQSQRKGGPFVAINCAALPDALLESELFGHVRGAFTDAHSARTGLFLQAQGGTLLLDEIGDLPLHLQPKLLRALEERTVRPIGASREHPFDARIVLSTNRDLEAAVEEGRFRRDLFYRINVIQLQIPPLRARGTDVLLLAQHFVQQFASRGEKRVVGISRPLAERLLHYPWPGNVRELRNTLEGAVALTRHERLVVDDVPKKIRSHREPQLITGGLNPTELVPMEEVERRYILHVLKAVGGHRTQAARVLGMSRKTLYRKLAHYDTDEL